MNRLASVTVWVALLVAAGCGGGSGGAGVTGTDDGAGPLDIVQDQGPPRDVAGGQDPGRDTPQPGEDVSDPGRDVAGPEDIPPADDVARPGPSPDTTDPGTGPDLPPEGCLALDEAIGQQLAQMTSCQKSADCGLVELGPICGSMSCRQAAVSTGSTEDQVNALYALGMQGVQWGCPGFQCGCGPIGAPVCIDESCRLCPPDCDGSCPSLTQVAADLVASSKQCDGVGECVVPKGCATCGQAVRKSFADKEFAALGEALARACGPCEDWCRATVLPYEAACVSGTYRTLAFGHECDDIAQQFWALVADPASLACERDDQCAGTSAFFQPFCTTDCACAVTTNLAAAHWVGVLLDEYPIAGCPVEYCPCTKCLKVPTCVDGRCQ